MITVIILSFAYYNLLKRGVRIALRSKINDCLISGLRLIDSILAIGRGQRQLILGDRYTGKTSIYLSLILKLNILNVIGSIDGLGTRRIFGIYIGINQNLSKLSKLMYFLGIINWFSLILATHSSSSSLLSFMIPLIAMSISERLRDRGYDICLCFDDLSKHSKAYRQVSLLLNKIPSRDAYPADVFNIHSSLLERCGKLKFTYFGGSITSLPIIETINADITEYIATNVISITDGQLYTNRNLFRANSSLFIIYLLVLGTIYTILYSINIYLKCFYYSSLKLSCKSIFYSFIIPFLIISSLILDIILEYHINLNVGSIFYAVDRGTFITYIIINEHISIIIMI